MQKIRYHIKDGKSRNVENIGVGDVENIWVGDVENIRVGDVENISLKECNIIHFFGCQSPNIANLWN